MRDTRISNSIAMTVLTALGMLFGVVVQTTLAYYFGAGPQMDAYLVAAIVPLLMMGLVNEPLGAAIIPSMSRIKSTKTPEQLNGFVASFVASVTLVMLLVVLLTALFGGSWIVRRLGPQLSPSQLALASDILSVTIVAAACSALAAVFFYIGNFHGRFLLPYSMGYVPQLVMVVSAVAFAERIGVICVAYGFLVGTVLQCVFLSGNVGGVRIANLSMHCFDEVWTTCKNTALISLSMLPIIVIPVVDRYLAAPFPGGSISCLSYSWTLAVAASSLVSRGTLTVLFPDLASRACTEPDELKRFASKALGVLSAIAVAGVAVGIVIRGELVSLLFVRGQFTANDAANVSALLYWHLFSVVGIVIVGFLNRVNYALRLLKVSSAVAILQIAVYLGSALILMKTHFVVGIAMANALSWTVSALALMWLFARTGSARGTSNY